MASKRAIAALASHFLRQNLYAIAAHSIPTNPNDLHQFKLLWEREVALGSRVLLLDCDDLEAADTAREQDIFFRQGAYDPSSKQGQQLLAHELTHVVQQNGDQKIQRWRSPHNRIKW